MRTWKACKSLELKIANGAVTRVRDKTHFFLMEIYFSSRNRLISNVTCNKVHQSGDNNNNNKKLSIYEKVTFSDFFSYVTHLRCNTVIFVPPSKIKKIKERLKVTNSESGAMYSYEIYSRKLQDI